ncbi:protein-tyrosine phosphatase-like protein, partial [Pavlovales sp. CCMP2436]
VLVHCSDGWDRTSQITALAQLQLDPYYRTLRGFAVLVEKEWLSFGHCFAQRYGSHVHSAHQSDGSPSNPPAPVPEDQQSPVFVQFVDAVWHLTLSFPRAFEFSQLFLAKVLEHVFSGRYGTFLLDTHAARHQNGLPQRTRSLWSDLLDAPAERGLVNPWYAPVQGTLPLSASDLSGCALEVFKAYYCRGPWAVDPRDVRAMAEESLSRSPCAARGGSSWD